MSLYDNLPKSIKEKIKINYKLLEQKVRLFYLKYKMRYNKRIYY